MPTFREKIKYGTAVDATITLASLASDTNLLVGRESNVIDNTTEGYLDFLISGYITTGTSPVANRVIEVWAVAARDDTTFPTVFDGTDSAETIASSNIKNGICKFIASLLITSASDTTYHFSGVSVASAFGGLLPAKFVLFVTQSSNVNLSSTANQHKIQLLPVYRQIESV